MSSQAINSANNNNTPESTSSVNILDLSDEILLRIVSRLGPNSTITQDLVNLSHSCTRFHSLLKDGSICRRVNVVWDNFVGRLDLVEYLTQSVRADIISELNLNDIYWLTSGEIKNIALKLDNLKSLYVCGTLLTFKQLRDIFLLRKSSTNIENLSWTWYVGSAQGFEGPEPNDFFKSARMSPKLAQLRTLFLIIPPTFKQWKVYYDRPPHVAFCYFLSLCTGLEKLWLYSYPKGISELVYSDRNDHIHFLNETFDFIDNIQFPNLVDFVYSIANIENMLPKLYAPKLVSKILHGFGIPAPKRPKQLWLDHPFLDQHCRTANSLNFYRPGWPQMDLSNLESISLPIFEEVLNGLFPNNAKQDLSKCKHIQITHGSENEESIFLNEYFNSAINLESFLSKASNYELDWNTFVEIHPKMTLVNVCQVGNLAYPDFCVALSKLTKLKRISVPSGVVYEIRECEVIQQFRSLAASLGVDSGYSTCQPTGLDFLTHGCRDVEEFELGFEENQAIKVKPGSRFIPTCLSSISLWKKLNKLTIHLSHLNYAPFLIEIARSCPLETLRLESEPLVHSEIIPDLCKALKFCNHLKDFRFESNRLGDLTPIFQALQSCSKLERLVIHSGREPHQSRPNRLIAHETIVRLMEVCTKLSVLYFIILDATKLACTSLRRDLGSMCKSRRPPPSILIHNSLEHCNEVEFEYPDIHYRQMVVFSSQVQPNFDYPDKFV